MPRYFTPNASSVLFFTTHLLVTLDDTINRLVVTPSPITYIIIIFNTTGDISLLFIDTTRCLTP